MSRPTEPPPPPVMGFVMLVLLLGGLAVGLLWLAMMARP